LSDDAVYGTRVPGHRDFTTWGWHCRWPLGLCDWLVLYLLECDRRGCWAVGHGRHLLGQRLGRNSESVKRGIASCRTPVVLRCALLRRFGDWRICGRGRRTRSQWSV
jgi:hypothetical protein